MLSILVNGEQQSVAPGLTVAELLASLKLNPRFLAVELNRRVIPRAEHSQTKIAAHDQIEIVTLVGGG
ncbi:sulfur carrier protein ThiS [Schlesneria sp.]|uniref:sulfur carrier protein ThiS n=1 Tax=Schlesneria sp. TaxID=2762018 RepID=UPI002F174E8E